MKENIKVSVIIPMYNAREHVRECLDSLTNQTLKEIEIICVNDGSTDDTQSILEEYAKKDERIVILNQGNLYAGVARNNGMNHASGEYLIFLDADDFFKAEMLERMYNKAVSHKADICICSVIAYSERDKEYRGSNHYLREDLLPENVPFSPRDEEIRDSLFQMTIPAPWNKLFKKSFINQEGITFDTLKRANDLYFSYLAMAVAERITVVSDKLVNYRVDLESSLQGTNKGGTLEFFTALNHLKNELEKRDLWEIFEKTYINRALNTCLFNLNKCGTKQAYVRVYNKLKYNIFYTLGILEHSKSYFYVKNQFSMMARIVERKAEDLWEILQQEALAQVKLAPYVNLEEWTRPEITESSFKYKVSVIIPVYNVEQYIGECLDSVINQTLKEIEIICVNDGTPDNSVEIVKKYQERDSRIKLINKENGGLSSARNAGIKAATGEYILFLDSDDTLDKQTLEYLYYECRKDNLDQMFFTTKELENCDGTTIRDDQYIRKYDYSGIFTGPEIFGKWVDNAEFKPSACLQINRTEFLRQNNLVFKEGIIHEDNLFTIQCLYFSKRVRYANARFYIRRVREDSIMTGTQNFKHSLHLYYIIMELEKFAFKENVKQNKNYYDSLLVQMERILKVAADYIKDSDEEELSQYIYSLNEEEGINFYSCVGILSELRNSNRELSKRARNMEEDYRVSRFRNYMQGKKKEKEINAVKESFRKNSEMQISHIKNSATFKMGKAITFLPRNIKKLFKRN